jgi:hypothetical protein
MEIGRMKAVSAVILRRPDQRKGLGEEKTFHRRRVTPHSLLKISLKEKRKIREGGGRERCWKFFSLFPLP